MNRFVAITGMHRSGTSFLARALNLSGLYLGEPADLSHTHINYHPTNLMGHWEHQVLSDAAEETLRASGGTWDRLPGSIHTPADLQKTIREALDKLQQVPSFAWGFKEPRLCVVFDTWRPLMPERFVLVGIFRHPLKVVHSLETRDNFEHAKSLQLWYQYNKELARLIEQHQGFLIDFDWPVERISDELALICDRLELPYRGINNWFSKELSRSEVQGSEESLTGEVANVYARLQALSQTNADRATQFTPVDKEELVEIARGMLGQLESQSNFYKEIHDKHLAHIKELHDAIAIYSVELPRLQEAVRDHENTMDRLRSSFAWKVYQKYRAVFGKQTPKENAS